MARREEEEEDGGSRWRKGQEKRGRANKGISITSSNAFTGNKPKA